MTVKRTKAKIVSDLLFCVALTSIFGELVGRFAGMVDLSAFDKAGILHAMLWLSSRIVGALIGLWAWSVICPLKAVDFRPVEKPEV